MIRSWAVATVIAMFAVTEAAQAADAAQGKLVPFSTERSLQQYLKSFDHRERDSSGHPIDEFFFSGPGYLMNQPAESRPDGGGLVHVTGRTLLVLRRGRVFSISLADGGMQVIDSIAVTPAGVNTKDPNYFDMLVSGDRIIVTGTCSPGDTAIVRIRLMPDGHLTYIDAHQISTFGGPTSLNYSPRIVDGRLVYFSARVLGPGDPLRERPAIRAWTQDSKAGYKPIGSARDYFAPLDKENGWTLHTLISCDVMSRDLACRGTGVFDATGQKFFMSENALYVWTAPSYDCWSLREARCTVYRFPLSAGPPTAIAMRGSPKDRQTVAEDGASLTVLMDADYQSPDIFGPADRHGAVAVARIPLTSFSQEPREIPTTDYRQLPAFADTGDYYYYGRLDLGFLIYGTGDIEFIPADEPQQKHRLTIVPSATADPLSFPLDPGIDAIVAIGSRAVVLGHRGKSVLARVMDGASKTLGDAIPVRGIDPSDTSGWYLDIRYDSGANLLTIPVARPDGDDKTIIRDRPPGIAFLRFAPKGLEKAGELDADVDLIKIPDHCVSSCYGWYDDVTPFFLGDRIFALLGYELVEGRLQDGSLHETARLNFAPR